MKRRSKCRSGKTGIGLNHNDVSFPYEIQEFLQLRAVHILARNLLFENTLHSVLSERFSPALQDSAAVLKPDYPTVMLTSVSIDTDTICDAKMYQNSFLIL